MQNLCEGGSAKVKTKNTKAQRSFYEPIIKACKRAGTEQFCRFTAKGTAAVFGKEMNFQNRKIKIYEFFS